MTRLERFDVNDVRSCVLYACEMRDKRFVYYRGRKNR